MTTDVVVIMGDEHQARALSCAGHPLVETPNLDALAARGLRFERAWTPSPICVPARASFATGSWVHQVQAWDSAAPYCGEPTSWAHTLRAAGYDVRSFGKLHHRGGDDDDGWTESVLPMYVAGGTGWLQGLPRRDPLPYPEAAELAADVGEGDTAYTRYDRRVTDAAVEWLSTPTEAPRCAFVSLVAPHYPLSAPDEFASMYDVEALPPPDIAPVAIDHPAVAAMAEFFAYHRWFDAKTTLAARRAYFSLVSWLDHNVGRIIRAIEQSGRLDDTLVVYTSDHGEMAGNRGLWCKSYLYRDSVDVPLIVAGPGVPTGVSHVPVNLVDVAPTVTAALGMDTGPSLVEIATADSTDRLNFSEYHDGGSITGSFAVQVGRWKYLEHVGFRPQLFDTEDDPDELRDLGADPGLRRVRAECADALRSIVDPDLVDDRAFASQAARLEQHGGRAGVERSFRFNHTPVP